MDLSRPKHIPVFISYARQDVESARRLYEDLKRKDIDPWLDEQSLLPGQIFEPAINEAIEQSRYFLALLSSHSVNKKGFVNKEIREAISLLDKFPESELFIIPVRLDDCRPTHRRLLEINWVDMFPTWEEGLKRILLAINSSVEKTPNLDRISTLYRKQLRYQYSKIPTIDPGRALDLSQDFISLRLISGATEKLLRENLETAETVVQNLISEEGDWESSSISKPAQKIEDALKQYPRAIILGDAGTGKTTLLQHLVYVNACNDDDQAQIPFFVSLADFCRGSLTIREFIEGTLERTYSLTETKSWLSYLTQNGMAQFLLDGLDEISDRDRERVFKEVTTLLSYDFHENNTICITSRIAGFKSKLPDFKLFIIEEFSRKQALIFVQSFIEDRVQADRIKSLIESNPLNRYEGITPLRRIIRTPLLLSVLTLVLRHSPTTEIPSKRVDVYSRCIEVLLREWIEHKGLGNLLSLDVALLHDLLSYTALDLQVQGKTVLTRRELWDCLRRSAISVGVPVQSFDPIIEDLIQNTGIITKTAHDLYNFIHLTFQEYLTARCLINQEEGIEKIQRYMGDSAWEEVVKMYAALYKDPDEICRLVLENADFVLCAKALDEMSAPLDCLRFILKFSITYIGTSSASGESRDIGELEDLEEEGLMNGGDPREIKIFPRQEALKWLKFAVLHAEDDNLRFALLKLSDEIGSEEKEIIIRYWREHSN